ncbi:hypothetical protein NBRC111894_3473 [Sporolactobacillus inulinus]|uniref:Uncharacterized protein n=1 Tax=Sporolactobacillus inulinus TaxID=2078 RepID=A0A4Y1ZFX1_9BACL|nr:hypothetical protein NBRC111894_3473 [Sporolactobacillus inulinus]
MVTQLFAKNTIMTKRKTLISFERDLGDEYMNLPVHTGR